jgi:hypothetical protein
MRACARVALASIAVSASISLSGCAAIEELKETFLRWVESQKLPSGGGVSADQLPEATPVAPPPENTRPRSQASGPHSRRMQRKPQRQTVVLPPMKPPIPNSTEAVGLPPKKPPIPDSTEAVRPEGTEGQSAASERATRWLPSRWPEAPPPGRFSR